MKFVIFASKEVTDVMFVPNDFDISSVEKSEARRLLPYNGLSYNLIRFYEIYKQMSALSIDYGIIHNNVGPAHTSWNSDGAIICSTYYINGEISEKFWNL